ncbi:MAG: response regulator transcription factor [Parachlamydiaceae bacterium]
MTAQTPGNPDVPARPQDIQPKIVIVDDDEDLQKILSFSLTSEGYTVKSILTGKEALAYLFEKSNLQSVSLLILDRLLPDMDGIQILEELGDKFPNHIPVLILSVLSAEKDVVVGIKRGAVDYIIKPFSLPILMEKVSRLLSQYKA